MATALKLRSDIKKLKKGLEAKGVSASLKEKLKSQLKKAEDELESLKKTGKAPKKSSVAGTKVALTALQKLIQRKKYGVYQGAGVDLKKDAGEGALATGRRVSKGLKSNQNGDKSDNKGNVYYEYRPNRLDVKQPKKKQSYPKLEDGGMMAKGGYMAQGGLTKEKLMDIEEEFEENEDDNYHSENVVLLARYFGTKEDLKEARSILKKHKEEGYLSGDNSKKRYDLSMKLFDKWDEAKKEAGIMAKGGEVKVGDIITAKTGVKVKVVEYDPKFGGRVKVMRMDEYGTGEPSQFMRLSKFKYGMGGYMAEGGVMSTTHRLSK